MSLSREMLILVLLVSCLASPQPVVGAEAPAVSPVSDAEMCARVQCRRGTRIWLTKSDGAILDETYDTMPVIQGDSVWVHPGSTVLFELVDLKLVDSIAHPEETTQVTLEQNEKLGLMLTTRNPLDKPLRIRMGRMPLDKDRLLKTSSCPVLAGGSSFETWPFPIFQVVLADRRLMSEDESMTCIE